MTTFLQFHALTTYGPSNPNRDDQGRPKQANVGGAPRLRLSSQSVKRAIRESSFFALDLEDHLGMRTKRLYGRVLNALMENGVDKDKAEKAAAQVAEIFGKIEDDKNLAEGKKASTLAFISPDEFQFSIDIAHKILAGEELPKDKDFKKMVLREADGAIDIAMFGRMLADSHDFNREAAVQVSHAITTHKAIAEDDWFTGIDDLNKNEDAGAGHLGEIGFGSGVYYQYICVNVDLLIKNLNGDRELAAKGLQALSKAVALSTPKGKQNSFAHHPRAFYMRAESGSQQPRDLTGAFFTPITKMPWDQTSIQELEAMCQNIDKVYGKAYDDELTLNLADGSTRIDDIADFAAKAVERSETIKND